MVSENSHKKSYFTSSNTQSHRVMYGNNAQWTPGSMECSLRWTFHMNYCKLYNLNMITTMDLCKIGKIITGSIEGGQRKNKITVLSYCVDD